MTSAVAAGDSVTVNTAVVVPEVTLVTCLSPIVKDDTRSSLRIVPVATLLAPSVPLVGLDSTNENNSSGSSVVSPVTSTVTTFTVCPAVKVNVPELG